MDGIPLCTRIYGAPAVADSVQMVHCPSPSVGDCKGNREDLPQTGDNVKVGQKQVAEAIGDGHGQSEYAA
jgi:hypothetical protein